MSARNGSSCVSATHSHTCTWPGCVYVSKVVCHALAVAGVTQHPCGLFPALTQESCMCVRHTLHSHPIFVDHLHAAQGHARHARTHAQTHTSSQLGARTKAQRRHNAHTDQIQTLKPVLLTTASMMELIASAHAAVPHDAGVRRHSSIS